MKKLIILFLVSAAVFNINSQTITQEFKDSVLANLYSLDLIKRGSAILDTYINDIPEAIPILESIIWEQDRYLGANVLDALSKYDSSNYITIANQFFDVVDTMRTELQTGLNRSPLEIKKDILFHLFVKGDYSKTNFLFELIEMNKPGSFLGVTFLLREVLNNVPEYYQQAKNELFRIAPRDGVALLMISDRYGSEANEVAYQAFLGAKDPADRGIALDHLIKHNYIGLESLIKSRVFVDTVWTSDLANTLLNKFGSFPNYKFIKDNYDQVNNIEEKRRINFTIEWFKPSEPDSSLMNEILVQALMEIIDSTYNYTWLGDLSFSNELKNILTTAKTNLQAGDSLTCRVQVKAFQDLVDNVYKDSLNTDPRFVTIEGWKFLYWNAQYILDRLPKL